MLDMNQQAIHTINYSSSNNGNIASKSDAGEYFYNSNRPFAIAELQNPEPTVSSALQQISYTAFNQPLQLTEGDYTLNYLYNVDEQRCISELYDEQDILIKKIVYQGNYEIIESGSDLYELNYLNSPEGLFGIAVKKNNDLHQLFYIETDHLGSIISLFDEAGQEVYSQTFDAWGRERNPQTWDYTSNSTTKPEWLIRGYTGHEHLTEFGLINMNGRMYDPILGRMLSPDNYVQDPSSTQSYNRYSYCWNNPLKYTDPDGELVNYIVGGIIGGIMGYINADMAGKTGWDMVAQIAIGAAIGTVTLGAGAKGLSAGSAGNAAATAKTAAATTKTAVTTGMKVKSGLYASGLNWANMMLSKEKFEPKDLLYFIPGFIGGFMGAQGGIGMGIGFGGISNVMTGMATGNIDSDDGFYETAQHFVGGALSGMAGSNMASAMAGSYKSSVLGKYGSKFLNYGLQGNAYDFAYTKKDKYLKKGWGQHFGTFINAGMGGAMQEMSINNPLAKGRNPLADLGVRFTSSLGSYYLENQTAYGIKANFYGLESKGFGAKMGLSAYKSLFNAFVITFK